MGTIRWVPKALYSALVGWTARRRLPRWARGPIYRAFARFTGARLEEVALPLQDYPSFAGFFVRGLRAGARPVDPDPRVAVCPSDGQLASLGIAARDRLVQVKGRDYSLRDLVVDARLAAALKDGPFVTLYLAPGDYHRVHAPVAGRVRGVGYIPGRLYPVNEVFSRRVPDLFCQNERVVIDLEAEGKAVAVVMVAALGVGDIGLSFADVRTRFLRRRSEPVWEQLDSPVEVGRGDELGAFHLGSTVVVVFEREAFHLLPALRPGARLQAGRALARMAGNRSVAQRAFGAGG